MANNADPIKLAIAKRLRYQGYSLRKIEEETGLHRDTIKRHTSRISRSKAMVLFHIKRKTGSYPKIKTKKKSPFDVYNMRRGNPKGTKKIEQDKIFYLERYRALNTLWTEYELEKLTNKIANDLGVEMSGYIPNNDFIYLYDNEPICACPPIALTNNISELIEAAPEFWSHRKNRYGR